MSLLRIDLENSSRGALCRIAGRLTGEAAADAGDLLRRELPSLVVELSELTTVDDGGLDFLLELQDGGAVLEGPGQYLILRLAERARTRRAGRIVAEESGSTGA